MLQIKHIHKEYKTGTLVQKALDDVSLHLRDSEFVAILGPSGSGKTTLLNIIGGLDRYDSGDLIINGISTKNYRDRDWDSYRNHTIGFVFQSYNLIPHQTILSNVELALTISGTSKSERKKLAIHALQQVGLGAQLHKKPNQLSGGQMQRVAIARALVNNPDILLADEPTGALDSDTSIQVMDLLQEVAKDRLVVMVTHNPELAEQYANRIVNLRDGKIISDSNPFVVEEEKQAVHQSMGKTSMSLMTSLSLSFNNLKTKKGRTILTAFAGSIGIIGIAAILSLSNGVSTYIKDVEENTLSQYPLQIQSSGFDMTSMMGEAMQQEEQEPQGDIQVGNMLTSMFSTIGSNDLASLKQYLETGGSGIERYTNAVEYTYQITPQIYRMEENDVRQVHPDQSFQTLGLGSTSSSNNMMSSMMSTNVFYPLPQNDALYKNQYDVKAGHWPTNANECVLVLSGQGSVTDFLLYTLGLRDAKELDQMVEQFARNEEVIVPKADDAYDYEDILGITFKRVNAADYYAYDATYHVWKDKTKDRAYMPELVQKGENLKLVGIVQPKEDATATMLMSGIYYTDALVKDVIKDASSSAIVKAQQKQPNINVFTGKAFDAKGDTASLDMKSLFTIDEAKMREAIQFDTSKLKPDMQNLNGIMAGIELPPMDLNAILTQLDISIQPQQLQALVEKLMKGFEEYIKTNPFADYQTHLQEYLKSPQVAGVLHQTIQEAIKENKEISISKEQMEKSLRTVLAGYDAYAKEHNLADMQDIGKYFMEYLKSEEAQAILHSFLQETIQSNDLQAQLQQIMQTYMQDVESVMAQAIQSKLQSSLMDLQTSMSDAFSFDANAFAQAITMNMNEQELGELMISLMSKERYTYENNLKQLGYADFDSPSQINIYPKDFESKEEILNILNNYNERMEQQGAEDKVITYTDMVGTLMSSVSDIINVISYVLIAFVAISLIVSSIMIGVITYISVLERKKEIGILRAIGASKRNISEVFNAETFIIGLLAGIIGIVITLLLLLPANQIIHSIAGNNQINASLPPLAAVILIVLSTLLTLLGGIIPSRKAAKEDPVTALRTE
ncbi:ABC transporter ATP-binding protein/permease [Amedibacillus dolichus]|uniref:ABC transporter ATP-binding protein/permease n=1 Tax=Amedibacillus dolichus TaxID=31971 RepID=UPI002E765882|nr:ABC transporter ATP-binding protein/permease [Amedibacillus dolichus]MEE0383143.1 ABC transporter ATP-binding protein/permease [Amedibacillus dolichus]